MDLSQQKWTEQQTQDTNSIILDVRTEEELEFGFIPNSKNIDLNSGADFLNSLEPLDKNKNYYIYCRSGNRSSKACKIMKQLGFKNLYNLIGGFDAWEGDVEEN